MEAQQRAPETSFPPLPLNEWESTKDTLHLYTQIAGKIRMALTPKRNHWWHVPMYINSSGWGTSPIPNNGNTFEINFDLIEHRLKIITSSGDQRSFVLENGLPVSEFFRKILTGLRELGITVVIQAEPYENKSTIPFASDRGHSSYDSEYVHRYWRVLSQINEIFKEFCCSFNGKCSPVHMFWHSFDLAVTRFSGKRAPAMEGVNNVTKEAYSHEVISAGFWPGDIFSLHEPAFYCYAAPFPEGLTEEPLKPSAAKWVEVKGSPMAVLTYEDFRKESDPLRALLDFLESSYRAGARRAGWNTNDLEAN
jgi:hypothetical protein